MLSFTTQHRKQSKGQALVEFALILPVLIFLMMGIFDFGRMLFAYSQASSALRDSLRHAEILGAYGSSNRPYLDCNAMTAIGSDNYFADDQDIQISYYKADSYDSGTGTYDTIYGCPGDTGDGLTDVADANLENGDLLHIELTAVVKPIFFPVGALELEFTGQRTIIKQIIFGGGAGDTDYDGLQDTWEETWFLNYPAAGAGDTDSDGEFNLDYMGWQDDPDGDGCNNGCEEDYGTDPLDKNDYPPVMDTDPDLDGIETDTDNCPSVANPGQEDSDDNGIGDACQDGDLDIIPDVSDNCPLIANYNQTNTDGDSMGDACDPDDDNDGIDDGVDSCQLTVNTGVDTDGDGTDDACDPTPNGDNDSDGIDNDSDNCPDDANPGQEDNEDDGVGDACDDDDDNDGVLDGADNCQYEPNPGQEDIEDVGGIPDGIGDACDAEDDDNDTIPNDTDNCPLLSNISQADEDSDGLGDACDDDIDNDGDTNNPNNDNCWYDANPNQEDADADGVGDACDFDQDNDGVYDFQDNCAFIANVDQDDTDTDGVGDACDTDDDNDNIIDTDDVCSLVAGPDNPSYPSIRGCPDDDADGFRDDNGSDQCVGTYGTVNGCPVGTITVRLRSNSDKHNPACTTTSYTTQVSVSVQRWDASLSNWVSYTSFTFDSSTGVYTFSNLPANADYRVSLPNSIVVAGQGNAYELNRQKIGTGSCAVGTNPSQQFTLSAGATVATEFTYIKP